MDYIKEFRRFVNSYYLNDGIKNTIGILLPVLVMNGLGHLPDGILIAIGAMSVNIPDMPGPIHHRRNALLIMDVIIFVVSLVVGFASGFSWGLLVILPVFCFVFSMLGVYGSRATAIGIGALLVMVIMMRQHPHPLQASLFVLTGGVWYTLLSLLFHGLRPYKLIQQSLGDYIFGAAGYLRIKADFYQEGAALEKLYAQLVLTQAELQQKENMLAELIFKTRSVVKESTHISRVLMMAFLDVADLVSIIMTTQQDYAKLHEELDDTGILGEYRGVLLLLADELEQTGFSITQGNTAAPSPLIKQKLKHTRQELAALRLKMISPKNLDVFISMRHILDSIDVIAARIDLLYQYTAYDKKLKKVKMTRPNPDKYVSDQSYEPALVLNNFSFRSHIFRHSIRVTIAAMAAYIIGQFLPASRSYWILLTVIVIAKPGYALSKTRNIERITGTLAGAAIAGLLLYFIKNQTSLLVFLILFMVGGYSFLRWKYGLGVFLMTVYLLLAFHFLEPQPFASIATERILDTLLGCLISFVAYWIIPPIWERQGITDLMEQLLEAAKKYYERIAGTFVTGNRENRKYRVQRKEGWVALANVSEALTRMLSEPKSKQDHVKELHKFTVSAHMLVSHIATLSYYAENLKPEYLIPDYQPLINATIQELETACYYLGGGVKEEDVKTAIENPGHLLDERIAKLKELRTKELQSGQMETATVQLLSDLKSIADQFNFSYKDAMELRKISAAVV